MTKYLFIAYPDTHYEKVKAGTHTNWSCSATSKIGDRILVYITGSLGIISEWSVASRPWKTKKYYRCKVQFLRDIKPPITIDEIRSLNPPWKIAQQNFRGHHSVKIPNNIYTRICKMRPGALTSYDYEIEKLNIDVKRSQKISKRVRRKRLKNAPRKPKTIQVLQSMFQRNTDVIAEVLERANGYCKRCGSAAPFVSSATGLPYLEVHHKIRLADGGNDTVNNAIALCPNCHRYEHYA